MYVLRDNMASYTKLDRNTQLIATPSDDDWATTTGNMLKNLVTFSAVWFSSYMRLWAERQTDKQR